MTEQMYANLTTEPDGYNRHHNFLRAALAVGLICSIQGEEKQHSARWNRTRSAEEAILRVCDILMPGGMDKARLPSIFAVIDGPVEMVLERHWPLLMDAVSMVEVPQ